MSDSSLPTQIERAIVKFVQVRASCERGLTERNCIAEKVDGSVLPSGRVDHFAPGTTARVIQ